jgi:hypothetical protein
MHTICGTMINKIVEKLSKSLYIRLLGITWISISALILATNIGDIEM